MSKTASRATGVPAPPDAGAPPPRAPGPGRSFLLRFGVVFALLFLALASHPGDRLVVVPLTSRIAETTGALLALLGERVSVEDVTIRSPTFGLSIKNGCNGIEAAILLAAAMFGVPASASHRARGLLAGLGLVQLLNFVRVVSLFYVGKYASGAFEITHVMLWPTVIIVATFAFFAHWTRGESALAAR